MQTAHGVQTSKQRGPLITALSMALLMALATLTARGSLAAQASPQLPAAGWSVPGVANNYVDGGTVTVIAGSLAGVSVGPLFPASLGCTTQPGTATSSAATLNLAHAGSAGAVTDHVVISATSTSVTVTSSSTVANLSLLDGAIRVGAINATAQSIATTTNLSSRNLSTLTNVVVAGHAITVKPNLRVNLPGIGYVILDEQSSANTATSTRYFVNAIHAYITTATLGLPVGAEVIVGHALSQFSRAAISAVVGASSYALNATGLVGSLAPQSGPYAEEIISCLGGQGTVSLTSATIGGLLRLGVMTDTANGQIIQSGDSSAATSTIANVGLGTGSVSLLNVGVVRVSANASFDASGRGATSGAVTLTNGSILSGLLPGALPTSPAPNTRIDIPLLGYVVLNQQAGYVRSGKVIVEVTGIEIVVTVAGNLLGLPVGAHIAIGVADAYATNPNN